MSVLFALAVSIGLLAVAATWLFFGPLAAFQMQVWQGFVAWASFFHNGGKADGLIKTYKPPFTPKNHDAINENDYVWTQFIDNQILPVGMKK